MKRELDFLFGNAYQLSAAMHEEGGFLPLYIKLSFDCYKVSLSNAHFLLVCPKKNHLLTFEALKAPLKKLEQYYQAPSVVYSASISAPLAAQFRSGGINYISIYAGCYLPFLGMLVPHYGRRTERQTNYLSPCAQAILIRQLVHGDIEGKNARQLAGLWPYSAMLLGNAKNELVTHGLCEYPAGTRSGIFHFSLSSAELWETAAPLMRSPVRKTYHVQQADCKGFLFAGISALSRMTSLGDDMLPTYAYYARKEKDRIPPAPPGKGDAVLQLWSYPPQILVKENRETVDACSLYLSLAQEHDPRVEIAREQIWNI